VTISDDDALSMGKKTLQSKNAMMERHVYKSLYETIGERHVPLRISHYGGAKSEKHLRCIPKSISGNTNTRAWHTKACNCGAKVDARTGVLSSLDAVDVERLVNDIIHRQFRHCVDALDLDRKNGMVSVPKVRVSILRSEQEKIQNAKRRKAENEVSPSTAKKLAIRKARDERLEEGASPVAAPTGMFGASASDTDSDSSASAPSRPSLPELVPESESPTFTPPRSRSSSFSGSSPANSASGLPSTSPSRDAGLAEKGRSHFRKLPVKLPSSVDGIKTPRSRTGSVSPKKPVSLISLERLKSLTIPKAES